MIEEIKSKEVYIGEIGEYVLFPDDVYKILDKYNSKKVCPLPQHTNALLGCEKPTYTHPEHTNDEYFSKIDTFKMKTYLVFKDNGQEYEDYSDDVVKVFSDKEKAQSYIKKEKAKKENKQSQWKDAIRFWIKEMNIEE